MTDALNEPSGAKREGRLSMVSKADLRVALSAAREAVEHQRLDEAADLLAQLWEAVPRGGSAEQVAQLRAVTEELGERKSASPEAAVVFRRAARCCAANGHYRLARRMGIRELAVWRNRAGRETCLHEKTFAGYRQALDALARIDRAVGRLHRVVNGLDELLELQGLHRGLAVDAHSAWTLRELGALMLQVGRPGTAITRYLSRADTFYQRLDESTVVVRQHAACLVLSGLALRRLERSTAADRCLNRALAMVLPSDPTAAAEVRTLIDAPRANRELPALTGLPLAEFGLPAWPAPNPLAFPDPWPSRSTTAQPRNLHAHRRQPHHHRQEPREVPGEVEHRPQP